MASVLVVDDDETIRDAVCMLLEDEGFVCLQAANGEQALRHLHARSDRIVVLLDLMMPRMSGKDVLNVVEADLSLVGRHAFILMTAADKTLPLGLVQAMRRMDVPIIGKPFELDCLVATVLRAVNRLIDDHGTDRVVEESVG